MGKNICTSYTQSIESSLIAFCKDNMGITLDNVEICAGFEIKPKKESKKVLLVGNCSIQINKDMKDAIRVQGCLPKVRDTFLALMNLTLDKREARRILSLSGFKNFLNERGANL